MSKNIHIHNDPSKPPILNDREARKALDSEQQDMHEACFLDIGVLAKTFLGSRFHMPYTSLHLKVIDAINCTLQDQALALKKGKHPGRKLAIEGGRGCAKTSFCIHALGFRQIAYGQSDFMVPITKAEKNTMVHTENLRRKLITDPNIKDQFGDFRDIEIAKGVQEAFGKTLWTVRSPVVDNRLASCWPRGAGQQVRGLLFDDFRPDFIAVDDIDDDKLLLNEEHRKWLHNVWFEGAVLRCVSQYEMEMVPWLVVVMDSCKHEDALIEKLMDREGWDSLRISVCDENFKTLCPEFISQESLDQQVKEAKAAGTLDIFAREMMSIPAASANKPFLAENFRYYPEDMVFNRNADEMSFVMMDPARSENPKNADTAIVGATVNFWRNKVYFRECMNNQMQPDEMVHEVIEMALRLQADHIGVEYAGLSLHMQNPLIEALTRRGLYHIQLHELKPQSGKGEQSGYSQGKVARIIWGLSSWYKWGIVYHHPKNCGVLETQLLGMPRSKKKDVADAGAYLRQLLEKLELRFHGTPGPENGPEREADKRWKKPLEEAVEMQQREDGMWVPEWQNERYADDEAIMLDYLETELEVW